MNTLRNRLSLVVKSTHRAAKLAIRGQATYLNWPLLKDEHKIFAGMCKSYADTVLIPIAGDIDRNHKYPKEQILKLGELGMLSVMIDSKWGGSGMDALSYAIGAEEISRGCASTGTIFGANNSLYCGPIEKYGTNQQKEQFIKPCTTGQYIGCFMLSEPANGSDPSGLSTTAVLDTSTTTVTAAGKDHYILNGAKAWITNAHDADYGIVFVATDKKLRHKGISAFLIDMKSQGISIGKKEDKLGIRGTSTSTVTFEDCKVPKENLLGPIGAGFKIAMETLDSGRIGVAGQAVGIARAALDCAAVYAQQRKAFDKPISSLYAIQQKLADMSTRIDAARLLTWKAAMLSDAKLPFSRDASQAKLFASETATYVAHEAIQILGGMGYVSDMPAERHYRDARVTEIYEGTSEIQHLIIAGGVVKDYSGLA